MSETKQEVFETLLLDYRSKWDILPDCECNAFLKVWRERYEKADTVPLQVPENLTGKIR